MSNKGATGKLVISRSERRFALLGWSAGAVIAISAYAGFAMLLSNDRPLQTAASGPVAADTMPSDMPSDLSMEAMAPELSANLLLVQSDIASLRDQVSALQAQLAIARDGQALIADQVDGVQTAMAERLDDVETRMITRFEEMEEARLEDPIPEMPISETAEATVDVPEGTPEPQPEAAEAPLAFEPAYSPPPPRVILAAPLSGTGSPERLADQTNEPLDPVAVSQRPMPDASETELARIMDDLAFELLTDDVAATDVLDNLAAAQADPRLGGQLLPPQPAETIAVLAPEEPLSQPDPANDDETIITGSIGALGDDDVDLDPDAATLSQTPFGLDLGGVSTLEEIDRLWRTQAQRHDAVLAGLQPRIMLRQTEAGALDLRLVAGPIDDAADAALMCARLRAAGAETCLPSIYDGQLLSR